jgi:SAM-dependent methyltransferase
VLGGECFARVLGEGAIFSMVRKWFAGLKAEYTALNYGRDLIARWCGAYIRGLDSAPVNVLDIGCGPYAADLQNVKRAAPQHDIALYGVEYFPPNARAAAEKGVRVFIANIERDPIPAADEFFDVVIANQIVEHAKDLFWIFAEVSRVLKKGGLLVVGVPNLASLHNRILLLLGEQPSSIELLGPHVRGFTAPALRRFIEADGYFKVLRVGGSNFYPFPPPLSTALSRAFPTLSVGLFVAAQRQDKPGSFIHVLDTRFYETAYYRGEV